MESLRYENVFEGLLRDHEQNASQDEVDVNTFWAK